MKIVKPVSQVLRPTDAEEGSDATPGLSDKEKTISSLYEFKSTFEDFCYAGYPWETVVVEPDTTKVNIGGMTMDTNFYSDYHTVSELHVGVPSKDKLMKLSAKEPSKELIREARWFNRHADRRSHMLIFRKCDPGPGECKQCRSA